MSLLQNKKILLGVTGSIAAYKSALLVRLLIKEGAEVKVIMTKDSTAFISQLTLSTLSQNPVPVDFYKEDGEWNNHVDYGLWADLFVIAPLSANTLSKMAVGACDNLLLATYLSAKCPVLVAPAMDLDMYRHPSTQRNLQTISDDGVGIIEAESGFLASGLEGQGRMSEPESILKSISEHFDSSPSPLKGKKALVTAGPTQEAIDPVRYISNHSSGKMGYAIADELQKKGCEVTLISGPTSIEAPQVSKLINVRSASEMAESCFAEAKEVDIIVLSAAVSDFKPRSQEDQKIKKSTGPTQIELSATVDIAEILGKQKLEKQFIVGFALETNNERENAQKKLLSKNFDIIVLNSLKDQGAGFGTNTNKITIIDRDNNSKDFELKSKREVAADIVHEIIQRNTSSN